MRNRLHCSLHRSRVMWALVAGMVACSTCASALPTLLQARSLAPSHHGQIKPALGPARISSKIILSSVDRAAKEETEKGRNDSGISSSSSNGGGEEGQGDEDLFHQGFLTEYQDRAQQQQQQQQQQSDRVPPRTHSHRYALQRSSVLDEPISAKAQVFHQCTMHFVALMQTEVSDRLLAQLSRFVMMLPLLGTDIKTVLVDEVEGIMDQILQGLIRYDNVHRVIKTAVDDSLLLPAGSSSSSSSPQSNKAPSALLPDATFTTPFSSGSSSSSSSSLENPALKAAGINAGSRSDAEYDDDSDNDLADQQGVDDLDEPTPYSRHNSLFQGVGDRDEDEDDSPDSGSAAEEEEQEEEGEDQELAQLWNYDTPDWQDDAEASLFESPATMQEEDEQNAVGGGDGREIGDDGWRSHHGTGAAQGSTRAGVSPSRRFWTGLTSRFRSTAAGQSSSSHKVVVDPAKAVLARIEPLANQRYYRDPEEEDGEGDDNGGDEEDSTTVGMMSSTENEDTEEATTGAGAGADGSYERVDESQIPTIAETAMDAIVDYVAEVLHPTLVIHEISNALQKALQEMKKSRRQRLQQQKQQGPSTWNNRLQHQRLPNQIDGEDDDDNDDDNDPLTAGSPGLGYYGDGYDARLAKSDHELDLLGDEWVWSEGGRGGRELEDELPGESIAAGTLSEAGLRQDEDLWDQDMEIQDWDETGHLFEMDEEDEEVPAADPSRPLHLEQEPSSSSLDNDGDNNDDDEEDSHYYPVGIQDGDDDGDGDGNDDDDGVADEADEGVMVDGSGDLDLDYGEHTPGSSYLGRGLFEDSHRLQRRSLSTGPRQEPLLASSSSSSPVYRPKSGSGASGADPTTLEGLLSQLMEPILNQFINHDFPASCQRAQGELMDAIIWSLDQKDDGVEADQLALLAELEY